MRVCKTPDADAGMDGMMGVGVGLGEQVTNKRSGRLKKTTGISSR